MGLGRFIPIMYKLSFFQLIFSEDLSVKEQVMRMEATGNFKLQIALEL